MKRPTITRRQTLKYGAVAALALNTPLVLGASEKDIIRRAIPASGEKLPIIGVGTNAYGVSEATDVAARREVLKKLSKLGNSVIDTAQVYGDSELVIGDILRKLDNRKAFFIATKTPIQGDYADPMAVVQASFDRLKVDRIDLMMIHNLGGTKVLMPALEDAKARGRIRYIGMSTSRDEQYGDFMNAMRRYPLDFIQVDYSIDNRSAAEQVLPLAQDRGMAVMINSPFGGRRRAASMFSRVANLPLPDFAADIDATSWAQIFLKYIISQPAVTVVIPGMTQLRHLQDNLQAGQGRLPDKDLRREIASYWDALAP